MNFKNVVDIGPTFLYNESIKTTDRRLKMDLNEALKIVLELAEDNMLDPDMVDEELMDQVDMQATAIEIVRNHIEGAE